METTKLPSCWPKTVVITHIWNTLTFIIILFVLLLKMVPFIFFIVLWITWSLILLPKLYQPLKLSTLHRNSVYTLPFEGECCIISVQTTIQMDLVRSALHKHIDILCFNAYLHLRLRLHPILRWDTPMHGFYTLLISHSILLQLSSVSSARLTTHEETSIFKGNLSLSHNPYLTIGRLFDSLDIHRIASHLMVGEAYKQLCISGKFLFLWTYYLLINLQDFLPWLKNHLHLR